ncbi:MAG: hypothetical protein AKCLJLPJ_02023 [Fimbriimonadales bacterium]|nr:hypothetical protein [Fimbriimonadales bacterium]
MALEGTSRRFRARFSTSRCVTLSLLTLVAAQSALAQDPVFITEEQARRSGPGHPWQGGPGSVNLFSLAKQTGLHLIGWRTKGGLPISFDLFHNSQARVYDPTLGEKWLHSCNTQLQVWSEGGPRRAAVIWGDHTINLFIKPGAWKPLDGYRNELIEVGTDFELTLSDRTVLHFGPYPPLLNSSSFPRRSVIELFRLESVEDPSGNVVSYLYDNRNRLVTVRDANSRSLLFHYNAGRLASLDFSTPGGFTRTWTFQYDPSGRIKRVTLPTVTTDSGPQTYFVEYSYDANGNIVAIRDPREIIWQYGYQGNSISFEQWPGNSSAQRVLYIEQGTLRKVTDPRGNTTTYEYDGLSRLIRKENASFFDVTYDYNHPDFVWSPSGVTLPSGDHYQYAYDSNGNLTAVTDAAGETWNMSYDSHNNLTQTLEPLVTDAFGNVEPARHRTDYQYDAMDRLVRVNRYRDQMNYDSSLFSYDAAGQLLSHTDPLGRMWSYQYDAYGNLTRIQTPSGRKTRWVYEDALTTHGFTVPNAWEDSNALRTELLRDEWGRLRVADFLNEPDRRYSYDAMNRLVRTIDGILTDYSYDFRGWLVVIARSGWNCTFGYYANGLLSSQTDNSATGPHSIVYNYDARNLLTSMNDMGMVSQYTYDANDRLIGRMLANGASATYGYMNGRLSSVMQQDHVAMPIVTHTYLYQDNGALARMNETGSVTRYQFDFLNRLIREERSANPAYNHTYAYDAAGNRIQHNRTGVFTTYQYDMDGLLTQAIPQGMAPEMYQYDANGRLVQRTRNNNTEIFQFTYDTTGNLRGLTQWNGQVFVPYRTFRYDALDRRVTRDVFVGGSQTEHHEYYQVPIELVSLSLVSCEPIRVDKNIQGQPSTELLTWSHGIQRSNNLTGTDYWPATDGLGNLRGYTGANGSAGNYSVVYDAFGQVVQQTGQSRVYGFGADRGLRTEGDADFVTSTETAWYDPRIGRSLARGPQSLPAIQKVRLGYDIWESDSFFDIFVEVDLPAIQTPSDAAFYHDQVWMGDLSLKVTGDEPSPCGTVASRQYPLNGGTFSSEFYVQPRFTFTRVDRGGATPSGMHGPDLSPSSPPGRLKKIPQLGDPIGWWPFWLPPW